MKASSLLSILDPRDYNELGVFLQQFYTEDCYWSDFAKKDSHTKGLVDLLLDYNLVWLASDGRILLTQTGEKVYQLLLNELVDLH